MTTSDINPVRQSSVWRRYWQTLVFKTYTDLKMETEITYLGFLWWLLEPGFFLGVYYVVFGVVMQTKVPNFIEFLFVGVVAWRWFGPAMTRASRAISEQRYLMQEVAVSKLIFPATEVLNDAIKFLLVFSIVLAFLILCHHKPEMLWLTIIPNFICQLILVFGLSFCFATITPFIPDFPLIIQTLMMALTMMSGVFFDLLHTKHTAIATILLYNPIADVLINYRLPLVYQQQPEWGLMLYSFVFGIALNIIGIYTIRKSERIFPKVCS